MENAQVAITIAESVGPELLSDTSPASLEAFKQGLIFASIISAAGLASSPLDIIPTGVALRMTYQTIVQRRRETGHPAGYYSNGGIDKGLQELVSQLQKAINLPPNVQREAYMATVSMLEAVEERRQAEAGIKGFSLEELLGESDPATADKPNLKGMWD